jgi:hypothetical protein
MIYYFIYGLLAMATLAIAIAPATRTLWKLGLLFFMNWVVSVGIDVHLNYPFNAITSATVDLASAAICFAVYFKFWCPATKAVMWVFLAQAGTSLWYFDSADGYIAAVALNSLFVLNALLIIFGSLYKLLRGEDSSRIVTPKDRRGGGLHYMGL